MKIQVVTYVISFTMGITAIFAQDAEFSQFYANQVYLNPAFAGSVKCPRISLNYRNQWAGIDKGFQTYSASYDQYVNALSGGVAFQILQDGGTKGTFNTTTASTAYAYHTNLSRKLGLNAGVKLGYLQHSVNLNELIYADQIDKTDGIVRNSRETIGTDSRRGLDLSTGLLIYSKTFFAGVAVNHLTEPKIGLITDSRLKRRYTAHVGMNILLDDAEYSNLSISPNLLFTGQGGFSQINVGVYITKGVVTGGIWYRNNDAMIILLGIDNKNYQLGYSYDITVSSLNSFSGGAHELSFGYNLPCRQKKIKYKGEKCKKMGPDKGKVKSAPIQCPSF